MTARVAGRRACIRTIVIFIYGAMRQLGFKILIPISTKNVDAGVAECYSINGLLFILGEELKAKLTHGSMYYFCRVIVYPHRPHALRGTIRA